METNTKPSVHIGFKMEPKDYLKLGVFAAKTGTNITGTATGLTAGIAATGDSATSFFSTGTLSIGGALTIGN